MTKEEFERLKREQKESGKSIKTFLANKGICFTSYYYWKKKYPEPKPETGLIPIEIHNASDSRSVNLETLPGDLRGECYFSDRIEGSLRGRNRASSDGGVQKSLGESCSL